MFPFDPSQLDILSRRQLMHRAAKFCFGVSALPFAFQTAAGAPARTAGAGGKAERLIYLFMTGAMSQLDTFDPKPKSDVQGETEVIKTKIPGVQLSEHMAGIASMSDQVAIIRSLNTTTAAHEQARYLMRTSYRPLATTKHPGLGSWMQKMKGRISKELPPSVQIGGGVGPGYLGAQYAPVPIGDPAQGLQNTKSPAYLTDQAFDKRMALAHSFDSGFRKKATKSSKVNGYDDLYTDAIRLLRSQDLEAFDITKEADDQKSAYGETRLGRGALLARRLVERGVRYVEISFGSWDHHNQIFQNVPEKAKELDKVVTTLLKDLSSRGLLDSTLVVIGTEFGRKPKLNQNVGRDHHPAAFSSLLAGGGIKGGQAYGKSDEDAFYVEEDGVSVEDFNATIAQSLGIPHDQEIFSPDGRPFTIGNGGTPIAKLF
ncbi:DUF1501 domain-containing protein [bacterium]|nr:DUF1501 domain-containing protein [bacterium]